MLKHHSYYKKKSLLSQAVFFLPEEQRVEKDYQHRPQFLWPFVLFKDMENKRYFSG